MKRCLAGRRILVTGASGGIGQSIAEQAAAKGAKVALAARSADKLAEIVGRIRASGGMAEAIVTDITSREGRSRLLASIAERWGGVDILVNNAGIGSFGHFAESSEDVLRQIMEVNFFAPAELIRLALPILKEGVQPAIVNVASMCGRRAVPAWSEYSASKFAVTGLSESLRTELVRFNIDVLLVLPGLTRTGLGSNLLRNEGRVNINFAGGMKPADVAAKILHAVERNRSEVVLGREARLMLWLNRLFPRLLDRLLARKIRQLYAPGE